MARPARGAVIEARLRRDRYNHPARCLGARSDRVLERDREFRARSSCGRRTWPRAHSAARPPSPGMRALRRAARFLTVVGFVLGLAYVWHIDLYQRPLFLTDVRPAAV